MNKRKMEDIYQIVDYNQPITNKKIKLTSIKKSFNNLPKDILGEIIAFLDETSYKNIKLCNKELYKIAVSTHVMRKINFYVEETKRLGSLYKINPQGIGNINIVLTPDNKKILTGISNEKTFDLVHLDIMDIKGVNIELIQSAVQDIKSEKFVLCFDSELIFRFIELSLTTNSKHFTLQNLIIIEQNDFNNAENAQIGNISIKGEFEKIEIKNSNTRILNITSPNCKTLKLTSVYVHTPVNCKNISNIREYTVCKNSKVTLTGENNVKKIEWYPDKTMDWKKYSSLEDLSLDVSNDHYTRYNDLITEVNKKSLSIKRLKIKYSGVEVQYIVENGIKKCYIMCKFPNIKKGYFTLIPISKYVNVIYLQNCREKLRFVIHGLFQGISSLKKIIVINCYDTEFDFHIKNKQTYRKERHDIKIMGFEPLPCYFTVFTY